MKISIVATLYRSTPFLNEFYQRMHSSVEQITNQYEIIFVDDGSPDESLALAKKIADSNSKVRVIQLSRNFGHHKAMMTGLQESKGDYIFLIDCDLEEAPELLLEFWKIMQHSIITNEKLDSIYGVQKTRKGGWFERFSGNLFFKIINFLSDVPVAPNQLTARLMTKEYVSSLLRFKEQELVFFGVDAMTGYNRKSVQVEKKHKGSTSYTLSKKIKLAMQFVTALSAKPLVYIFYLGAVITLFSFLLLFFLLIKKIFFGSALIGWTSVIASIWFFGGLLIFCIGVLGIYISIIFSEAKNRPFTIIQNEYSTIKKDNLP